MGENASSAVGVLMWWGTALRASDAPTTGKRSISQSFSALCASSFQDISAVSGLHSLSEAVFLFSLTLFRLISSKHSSAPPLCWIGSVSLFSWFTRFYTMTFYIITCTPLFCQVFFEKNNFLWQKNCFLLTKTSFVCYNDRSFPCPTGDNFIFLRSL